MVLHDGVDRKLLSGKHLSVAKCFIGKLFVIVKVGKLDCVEFQLIVKGLKNVQIALIL